jgi:hypothetical protein
MQKIWGMEHELQIKIITFLWRCWTARNKANAGERVISVQEFDTAEYHYQSSFATVCTINVSHLFV